ncbi:ABC transporter substrate-binding protein [Streptomyces sp. WAC08241]|uniref:ABC transporter substrate-binding protein n=1 Tax=Streptomyces sp. WAC08241 TaxID=2487421 RepID=UPI0021AE978E|nr:ABC transporter substrate-binding protein [Streptomyces sp. WAC08241]
MSTRRLALPLALLLLPLATACGSGAGDGAGAKAVTVTVGYQSKTINTVTAGTLLRSLGYFEEELAARGRKDGVAYRVNWQDYATGAPITAQMTAGKIDIGSMGDFPLHLNAARGKQFEQPTRLVSVTGCNLCGGLNTVVTAPGSPLRSLADLKGRKVSTSVGSATDGTLVRAFQRAGLDPAKDVRKLDQQPSVGASALAAGSVDALSRFVARPGLLAFQGRATALYDGAELDLPTFHGVTVRERFAKERPAVPDAFLRAQRRATDELRARPVASAESVAEETGLPAEAVHLCNGARGIATFDPALRPELVAALREDVPVLAAAGLVKEKEVDVDAFVDPAPPARAAADSAREVRVAVARGLAAVRDPRPGPLAPLLDDAGPLVGGAALDAPVWQVRAGAATALRAAPSALAVPALAPVLADGNADVRKAAVLSLLAHREDPAAGAAPAGAADDPGADVRAYAARAAHAVR